MYGWERLTSACGLGCKVFWSPWANAEKAPYDAVMKDDDAESCDPDPVMSEPQKPDWGDLTIRAPIVKNKPSSVTNVSRSGASYEKLPAAGSVPKLNNKRLSKPELFTGSRGSLAGSRGSLTGSRGSLTGSRSSLTGSTASSDVLEVREMVTTV